jgi:hypothetical protein
VRAMMGRLDRDQRQLFYCFNLEEVVPEDHLVRAIAAVLDLSWVRAELAPHYSPMGRPSIDPLLMIRMLAAPSPQRAAVSINANSNLTSATKSARLGITGHPKAGPVVGGLRNIAGHHRMHSRSTSTAGTCDGISTSADRSDRLDRLSIS